MSGPIVLTIACLILMLLMGLYTCHRIGGIVKESGDFWTCYYLLVPNWFTKDQFESWMNQPVPLGTKEVTRKEALNACSKFAEHQIKTISDVLISPAPYEVYEIVTV